MMRMSLSGVVRQVVRLQRRWRSTARAAGGSEQEAGAGVRVSVVNGITRNELGEGSMWWPERESLLIVDIMQGLLKIFDPVAATEDVHKIGKPVGTVVLRDSSDPRCDEFPILLGTKDGFEEYDPESRRLQTLASPEAHLPLNRSNDGKCDPRGRFWLGTMSLKADKGAGNMWCLDTDGAVHQRCAEHSLSICNGPSWSPDEHHFYFVDTLEGLFHFDFNPENGEATNGKIVARCDDEDVVGLFDGTTMDKDGHLWIAHWGGGRVSQWKVNGGQPARKIRDIEIPGAQQVTSIAFGGPTLEDMYVTSAFIDLTDEQRQQAANAEAGKVFRITGHGAQGLPPHRRKSDEKK